PLDALFARPASADASKSGNRNRGIGDLMPAEKLRQRQVEQTVRVLINHTAVFLEGAIVLTIDIERRPKLIGATDQNRLCFLVLRSDDGMHAAFDDAGFFHGDGRK